MQKQGLNRLAGGALLLALLLPLARPSAAQAVTPSPRLDLNRFVGTWYEIARLPDKKEKHCAGDAMVLYALRFKPYHFQMVSSCRRKDNTPDARNFTGRTADHVGDGKLKIDTIFPFTRKYWVLALDPGYEWALVGTPNHKSLCILSRSKTMKPDLFAQIEARASAEGFDTAKLIMVPQTTHPEPEHQTAASSGK